MPTKSSLWFVFFGLIFLCLSGGFAWKTWHMLETGTPVQAEVVELVRHRGSKGKTTYAPVFRYQFKAQTYTVQSNSSSNPASYEVGEQAVLTLDPADPEDFISDSFSDRWLLPLITGFFGVLFASVGVGALVWASRRQKQIAQLAQTGERLQAQVISVVRHRKFKVNRRSPWHVLAQATHPVTGALLTFKSDNLWNDPSAYMNKMVEVHIDRRDPKIYYVVV